MTTAVWVVASLGLVAACALGWFGGGGESKYDYPDEKIDEIR